MLYACYLVYSHNNCVSKVLLLSHFRVIRRFGEVKLLSWGHSNWQNKDSPKSEFKTPAHMLSDDGHFSCFRVQRENLGTSGSLIIISSDHPVPITQGFQKGSQSLFHF